MHCVGNQNARRMRRGGKGALVGDNLSHTLQTGNDQTLIEFAQDCANTVEASCYKGPCGTWNERTIISQFWNGEQVAESLTTTSNNQRMPDKGRMQMVLCRATQQANAETFDNLSPTLTEAAGTSGNNQPIVCGGFIRRQGSGAGSVGYEENVAPTQRSGLTTDVVCFQQNTRDEVRKMNGDGEIAGALAAEPGMKQQNYLCYDNQTYARNPQDTGSICGTLEAHMGTGGNTVPLIQNAVAIAENVIGRKVENGGNGIGAQDELAYTQNATGVMGVCTKGNGDAFLSDVHTSLSAAGGGQAGQGYPAALQQKTVRRLLPVEAERLMGHPDNHTRISWQGKPESECPDAPRYKAEGNSMTCNCMEWIGRRIEEFDR